MSAASTATALWPTVPRDATVASLFHAARRYTGRSAEGAAIRFLGVRQFQGDLFAVNARPLSEIGFGGQVSPETIVHRHTPFNFYSSFLSVEDEAKWLSAIVGGDLAKASTFRPPTKVGRIEALSPRLCPACLCQDTYVHGVGHWRVGHQLPALLRCPWHRVDLHDRCADCGRELASKRSTHLPGDPCSHCMSTRTCRGTSVEITPGYVAMEGLVARALVGGAPELRPPVRVALADRVIHRRVGSRGLPDVVKRFLGTWSVSTASELGVLLGCVVSESKLLGLFAGVESATTRTLQAAVIAFVLAHASADDLEVCTAPAGRPNAENLFDHERGDELDSQLLKAFCAGASACGYPIEGARALAAGMNPRSVANRNLASPNVTKRFLATFPEDLQLRYQTWVTARGRGPKSIPQDSAEARRVIRRRIVKAVKAGCTTRDSLNTRDHVSYKWALRHDPRWLDRLLPRQRGGGTRKWAASDRSLVRGLIVEAISGGITTRSALKLANLALYGWAFRNDREWFNGVLPSRRPVQRTIGFSAPS